MTARLAVVALLAVLLPACNSIKSLPEGEARSFETRAVEEPVEYRIQPGDGLTIKFAYHQTRDLQVGVRPDGRISIPFAEEVHVAGLTVAEADDRLTAGVAQVLRDPELTIVVTKVARSQVYVGGEVLRPGAVPLVPGLTATQALFAAGGAAPTGDTRSVILIRAAGPGKREVRRLSLEGTDMVACDRVLAPFDIVFVPRTFIADVGVFVNSYINAIIPRSVSFTAFYNLHEPNYP